jgi:hypothetical protein
LTGPAPGGIVLLMRGSVAMPEGMVAMTGGAGAGSGAGRMGDLAAAARAFRAGTPRRRAGLALNLALRLSLAYFLAEALLHPDDPRFAGKAIPVRNLIIVGSLSLLLPALQLWRRRWPVFPYWLDNLYLSIFWLDMAGNSFNLYDRYYYFDVIPHAHGTGAAAVVLGEALGLSGSGGAALANGLHLLLEGQEFATDVFFGTHNVRGAGDTIHDLLAGVVGTGLYLLLQARVGGR